ncbi:MAG TPA: ABC transporter ATP-binding protein [Candidatus Saccharimonadales bacterium]|nr:ABC transporter ATP-binding protein [Candidatus Saccharimonadales bacterium]
MTTPLRIENLAKSYGGRPALAGVSLEISEGEILGLLGPNGAGKTTLIRCVVGRVVPTSGAIAVFGEPVGSAAARARIGYIPQEIALYGRLTAAENLGVFGRYAGLKGMELANSIKRSLDWAGLSERAADPVMSFSGGMKRRLNMAAGLLHQPRLILLDEPTTGVDPQSRQRIYTMVEELRAQGVSVIYTTHYMEEAERLCDRVAIIDHGKIIASGPQADLVRGIFGSRGELVLHLDGGEVRKFTVTDPAVEIAQILASTRAESIPVRDLSFKAPNLESVFLQLTGRELRE